MFDVRYHADLGWHALQIVHVALSRAVHRTHWVVEAIFELCATVHHDLSGR